MSMEHIKLGTNVDIKRTDGRVHSAVVSGVNPETRSVTVEWFERGETKGKEIEIDIILELNPDILGPPVNATELPQANRKAPDRRQTIQPQPSKQQNGPVRNATGIPKVTGAPPHTTTRQSMGPTVPTQNGNDENAAPLRSMRDELNIPASVKRPSNTVKEIERLKKNREERRAQHEDQRAKRQELLEQLEPGNPLWEFLQMINEFRDGLDIQPLKQSDAIEDHQICVCVRKRPLNAREAAKKEMDVLTVPNRDHMIVHEPKTKVDLTKYLENQTFRFDYAFDENSTNEMVYRFTAQPLVKTIFQGGMATCFAYGQTGSGKTHTMGGDFGEGKTQDCSRGIYALTARDVFKLLHKNYKKENLLVYCSFFEIYSGKVFDLLSGKSKLRILEDGKQQMQIVGLAEEEVESDQDVLRLIQKGSELRTAGQTSANNQSSRSHAVFQIILKKRGTKKVWGKFSLIDLAGNERGADTSSSNRQTRMEGAEINKSLLALKECIRALGRRNAHLPFRASKLTLVLRDSFVGENARTCMIAMVSPGIGSCEHTLNTMRYADRVKELGANPDAGKGGGGNIDDGLAGEQMNDSDLTLLHSHNEQELTDELYNYQMDVSKLQELEDQVVDNHGKVYDDMVQWTKSDEALLRRTNVVDFDAEKYAEDLDTLLAQKVDRLTKFRAEVQEFRRQLAKEEQQARTMTNSAHGKRK